MNEQIIGQGFMAVDTVENTDMDTLIPVVNPEPFTDQVPVETALFHEPPLEGVNVAVAPVEGMIYHEDITSETFTREVPPIKNVGSLAALLNREESEHFRTRWNEIQSTFVDEPRSAVQQADGLVSDVIEQITQMFTNEHSSLEVQWNQGKEVSTEDLRKALQRYRSFFNRLVV
jgi:hypothetical protein